MLLLNPGLHNKLNQTMTIKMKKYITLLILSALGLITIYSCKKDYSKTVASYVPAMGNYAFIKVINGTVGSAGTYVYQDALNEPMSGYALSSTGYFPTTTAYAALYQGNRSIIIKDTTTNTAQKAINYTGSFAAGNYYTIFMYDTAASAKYILVQDKLETPTDTTARIRFANLIYSSTPVANVDIFSTRMNTNLFTNVSVGQVTDFAPFATRNTDTLYVRSTGTTTNLAQASITATSGRSYTAVFEGRYQTTTGTYKASNPTRSLLIYTNR